MIQRFQNVFTNLISIAAMLSNVIQNIYTYIISVAGVIALVSLVAGGILFLTSAGDPEKLSKAKKQILATLFGILILFSSYIILRTINPELVSFEMPRLKEILFSPLDMPPSEALAPKLLGGVIEIAEKTKEDIMPAIEYWSYRIKELTDQCDCSNTQPLCYCTGGDSGASCQPRLCYAGPGFQPCPNYSELKENQERVIAWKDEIIYYKNRAINEAEDLKDETEKVLEEEIRYYQDNIATETEQRVIEYFEEQITELEKEKELKEDLTIKLEELAELIRQLEPFILEIAVLPDKCLYDDVFGVNNRCNANCSGGCHDVREGCQPVNCDGGNPCPVGEINDQLLLIQGLEPQIMNKCDEILNIIDEIIKLKTITI